MPRKRPPRKSEPETPPLIEQAHGGALYAGGVPANRGGPGRPRDEIRARLAGVVDRRGVDFINQVMSGEVTVTMKGTCAHCGKANDGATLAEVRTIVASVDHRLQAFDKAAKYGIGTQTEVLSPSELEERLRTFFGQRSGLDGEAGRVGGCHPNGPNGGCGQYPVTWFGHRPSDANSVEGSCPVEGPCPVEGWCPVVGVGDRELACGRSAAR